MQLKTINNYDFFEVSSSMQKAIRRNDSKLAGYFALELWHSNYREYVWKRLFTISAEDCGGLITHEINSLYNGYLLVNKNSKAPKGRIFISKAVLLLCAINKNRDADHLQNLIYDNFIKMTDAEIENYFDDVRKNPLNIPDYAFDVHTRKGKKMGKTKKDFFQEEFLALKPVEKGLFDNLI